MSEKYDSFLICFHETQTDVYHNGLPMGLIREGRFEIHHRTLPDGGKYPVEIDADVLRRVGIAVALIAQQP